MPMSSRREPIIQNVLEDLAGDLAFKEIEAPASLRHSDICRLEVPSSARVFGLAGSLAVMTSACAALQLWPFFIVGHIKEAWFRRKAC